MQCQQIKKTALPEGQLSFDTEIEQYARIGDHYPVRPAMLRFAKVLLAGQS